MEDGGSHWYEDQEKEHTKEKEQTYPRGWFWCPERKDYFRYKEWLKL